MPSNISTLLTFRVLEQTCVNQVKKIDQKVATELVNSMLRAMTENLNYEPTVQMGASAVLVAIGHEYLDLVRRMQISIIFIVLIKKIITVL